jgi:hypothetical protein
MAHRAASMLRTMKTRPIRNSARRPAAGAWPGRFAGDISFPHQLHMRPGRSPVARWRVVTIDVVAARATPGVVAVWTSADIADIPPIDFRESRIERLEPYRQPLLAVERVRGIADHAPAAEGDSRSPSKPSPKQPSRATKTPQRVRTAHESCVGHPWCSLSRIADAVEHRGRARYFANGKGR